MNKMETVLTLRLPKNDIMAIKEVSERKNIDKSTAARKLIELGKLFFAIDEYKKEKISFGKAAEIAGLGISDMMDALTELGIKSNLAVEDYITGKKTAKKLIQ
ncbi:MAG: UPF0175 family protein [Candidatus Diapherotrites archaeon]|nr:UPF0175 family protein [Candidatus Diapherotrites archaeon]